MEIHDSRPVDYRWHIMMMMPHVWFSCLDLSEHAAGEVLTSLQCKQWPCIAVGNRAWCWTFSRVFCCPFVEMLVVTSHNPCPYSAIAFLLSVTCDVLFSAMNYSLPSKSLKEHWTRLLITWDGWCIPISSTSLTSLFFEAFQQISFHYPSHVSSLIFSNRDISEWRGLILGFLV